MLFRNETGENDYASTQESRNSSMKEWENWIGNIAVQGKLVSSKPITFSGSIVSSESVESKPFIDSEKTTVSGYLICKADSENEAKDWAKSCPILKFPKGQVEIRELLPFDL